jgi:hypothetical protein
LTLPVEGLVVPTRIVDAALIPWPLVPATLIRSPLIRPPLIRPPLIWSPLVPPLPTVDVSAVILSTVTALVTLAVLLWPARLPGVSGRHAGSDSQRKGGQTQCTGDRGLRDDFLDVHCATPWSRDADTPNRVHRSEASAVTGDCFTAAPCLTGGAATALGGSGDASLRRNCGHI